MNRCRDTDELRAFLRTIATYDEFWERKEPDLDDAEERAFWDEYIRLFSTPRDIVLEALKQGEVRRFVREQSLRKDSNIN